MYVLSLYFPPKMYWQHSYSQYSYMTCETYFFLDLIGSDIVGTALVSVERVSYYGIVTLRLKNRSISSLASYIIFCKGKSVIVAG